jgi:hypothetical protein
MLFELTIYKDIIAQYPTWNILRSYLESEEGGLFRIVDMDIMSDLCIIRYDKEVTNMNLPHSSWFRSVVWNTMLHRPVCVAPPKTSTMPLPFISCNEAIHKGFICQELQDGIMINCFKMAGNKQLYITTRSSLYAAGRFYSSNSFRKLFIQAYLHLNNRASIGQEEENQVDATLPGPKLEQNEYAVYYSFLLQHTQHRIVKKITDNTIFLVQKGIIYQNGNIQIEDSPMGTHSYHSLPSLSLPISNESISEWMQQLFQQSPYDFQGIVLKDRMGNRWRYRSEKYMMVKSLRGNHANVLERYSELYVQNLQYIYLAYYPEDVFEFSLYSTCMSIIIDYLYENYIDLHVMKAIPKNEILENCDKMYHPHLYALHGIYLTQLRPSGNKMTKETIQYYFHKLPWQRIAFLLRRAYDTYISFIDSIAAENAVL